MTIRELVRWHPLMDVMDRVLEDKIVKPWHLQEMWASGFHFFPADILETRNDVIVKARLPGMNVEDVDIAIEGNMLTIKGEYKEEEKATGYFSREMHYGAFSRSFTLPVSVKTDKVAANLERGILTIKLPKKETARSRTIKVVARSKPVIEASKK